MTTKTINAEKLEPECGNCGRLLACDNGIITETKVRCGRCLSLEEEDI